MTPWGDNRGQSNLIGAIFLFGFIVAALGANQAVLVPQANAEVEFKHSQNVQSDMVDLRSNIISAAGRNELQSTSINLAPQYPNRYLAINPSQPAGTLSSTDAGEIDATGVNLNTVCGTGSDAVETDHLNYRINYNEQNSLPIAYDNSVVYRQDDSSSQAVFDSGQSVIKGNTIRLLPITADLSRSSTQTTSVDLYPTDTGRTLVSQDLSITFPSELSASQWDELISSQSGRYVESISKNSGKITIEFEEPDTASGPDEYIIKCTYIGVDEKPDADPVDSIDDINRTTETLFNPNSGLEFRDSTIVDSGGGTDSEVNITFRNEAGGEITLYESRVAFYSSISQGSSGKSQQVSIPDTANFRGTDLEVTGPFEGINNLTIAANSDETVTVEFFDEGSEYKVAEGEWFFMTITYERETGVIVTDRYLIAPEKP